MDEEFTIESQRSVLVQYRLWDQNERVNVLLYVLIVNVTHCGVQTRLVSPERVVTL